MKNFEGYVNHFVDLEKKGLDNRVKPTTIFARKLLFEPYFAIIHRQQIHPPYFFQ